MKRILIAPVTAALLSGHAFGHDDVLQKSGRLDRAGAHVSDESPKEGFSLTADVHYTDHTTDHYRQTKYSLADGVYTIQADDERLEVYLEGKAGTLTEAYRYDSGYASQTLDPKLAVYVAAEIGAKYHLLDNVALGARFVMADNVPEEEAGQNLEMSLNYTF